MKTIEFTAYEVVSTDGYTDRHEGYCATSSLAQKFLEFKKLGAYGRVIDKPVTKSFLIYETEQDFVDAKKAKLLASAKAKLSKEEMEALFYSFQSQTEGVSK